MTFQELANKYLDSTDFSMLSDNSQKNYTSKINKLIEIDGNAKAVLAMDCSNATKKIYLSVLKTVVAWGRNSGEIVEIPEIPQKLPRTTEKDRNIYTKEEVELVWSNCFTLEDKIYGNFLRMCFYTGCRPSELFNLTWENVGEDYINLISTKRKELGTIGRKCAITDTIQQCLDTAKWMWDETARTRLPSDKVFKSRRNGHLNPNYTGEMIHKLCSENDVAYKQLRHARAGLATAMHNAGYSMSDIQGQLGHSSVGTTERYVRPTMDQVASRYKGV